MAADAFRAQVALLLRVLPFVAAEACFALKGGTAINLFVRNLPRLSVDIDLVYLPIADRETSLADIRAALRLCVIFEHDRNILGKRTPVSRRQLRESGLDRRYTLRIARPLAPAAGRSKDFRRWLSQWALNPLFPLS